MPFQNTIAATFTDPTYLAARERFWSKAQRVSTRSYNPFMDEDYCEWCEDLFEFHVNAPNRRRYCSKRCRDAAAWDRRRMKQDVA